MNGEPTRLDPPGLDGWPALVDEIALGKQDHFSRGRRYSAATLWCKPRGRYSYATASIHIASMIVRHIAGMELQDYLQKHLAEPMGWGRWGYGYKYAKQVTHTPGGGGITLRATDMLCFGYLLLHEGRWGDKQLGIACFAIPSNLHVISPKKARSWLLPESKRCPTGLVGCARHIT